ncbi:xre family transcriptional regulator [Leptolyngbya sp. Heron Island J]|uniref:helix-turn-helix domain-containing protein n=1 Tax=Leptolyngbya sp. Heron Island J TaxID=1385935 RepID=UPI0003B94C5E|nr:helix-turn-helix transcriptional regulator [Leptolyngbya sp. Heron Island J]ESA37756.1 xre family transcriptional regulator [Leptolyngbya sp. Heron Island J]
MINAVKVQRIIEIEVPGLGERIKKARQQKQQEGRTMTDLASAVGMSVQNWYRIEKESQTLAEDVLKKIEEALGVSFGVKFDE